MRVFLDTNVWLSATLFSGLCAELVAECADNDWLITSKLVQAEAHEVLIRKFPHRTDASRLFDAVWYEACCTDDVIEPSDDADARLVSAAASAGSDLFVTGDRRVLDWKTSNSMHIVTPRQAWLRLFPSSESH